MMPKIPEGVDIDSIARFEIIDGQMVMHLYGQKLLVIHSEINYHDPEYARFPGYNFVTDWDDSPKSLTLSFSRYREPYTPPPPPKRTVARTLGLRRPK